MYHSLAFNVWLFDHMYKIDENEAGIYEKIKHSKPFTKKS